MRLLVDENFPKRVVNFLRSAGHDTSWVREEFPQWEDLQLVEIAEAQARILLTFDKGFVQLATQRRRALRNSGIVVFRVHPATAEGLMAVLPILEIVGDGWLGHASTLTPDGVATKIPLKDKT